MNRNGVIDFNGTDRIAGTINDYAINSKNIPVQRTRNFAWAKNNQNTPNLVSWTETSLDGLQTWNNVESLQKS
jgi:hypothetical protein